MTIREYKGSLKGLKLCFVGDGNNMANSLIVGGIKMGMQVSVACPDEYRPDAGVPRGRSRTGSSLSPPTYCGGGGCGRAVHGRLGVHGAGEREGDRAKRRSRGSASTRTLMPPPKPDAMVLHCLPAHRGEEIDDEVFEAHAQEIFDEAENRLHAQKAVLVKLLK